MIRFFSKFLYIFPSSSTILIPWFASFITVSLVEVFGIGVIGPFIYLASNPENVEQNEWLNWAYIKSGFNQTSQFIALIGVLIIFLFCFKAFASWYIQSHIFKFSYIQKEKLIARLMHGYIEAPYTLYLDKNSAQIIQSVTSLTSMFADALLSTLLNTASNLITIIAISILLCSVSPLAVICLLLLAAPLFLIFNGFRGKMNFWGKELHHAAEDTLRSINHGLGGFKETRIIGCGLYFEKETVKHARRYANASIQFYAFKLSPRFIIETMLIVFIVGFTSVALVVKQNIQDLTSILSIFAISSIRLIPALSSFINGLSVLRTNNYAFNQLYSDLKELEKLEKKKFLEPLTPSKTARQPINSCCQEIYFNNKIILDNVIYRYPNTSEIALNEISLTIQKGQSIALIGKSGAGKTTLVDVILGLLVPQKGDIKVDDISIYENLRSWQNMIGYIPQSIFLIDDTVERNIAFGIPDRLIDQTRLAKAIHAAQLTEVVGNLPEGAKTRVGERGVMLSGGQRQRIGIARALYHEREILVLDEATSALDSETENLVTEAIKSLSGTKTMIIIAHRLTTVEHCDRIYLMEKGQVVKSGSYGEVVLAERSIQS